MKRAILLLLTMALVLGLCACGAEKMSVKEPAATPEPVAEATPEPTPGPEEKYAEAERMLAAGDYASAAAAFEELGSYGDAHDRITECRYEEAKALIRIEDYEGAREILESIRYADSAELCRKLDAIDRKRSLSGVQPGDTIYMGHYEQNQDLSDGPEPVEWLVIRRDEDNNRIQALSLYCLDSIMFNSERGDVTWETSTIRQWLNSEFYDEVFSDVEKILIPETKIDNSEDNWRKGTSSGRDTYDHVYFLSYNEFIEGLVNTNSWIWDLQSWPTQRAKENGAATGKWGNSWWWLRTAGKDAKFIMYVDFNGIARSTGFQATHQHSSMRPAVWIDLNEDIF